MSVREPEVPDISELRTILAHGTSPADAADVRRALGLAAGCEDKLFAQALVRAVARAALPALPSAHDASSALHHAAAEAGPHTASRSFMMRAPVGAQAAGLPIARLDDIRTLLLVVRAGSLLQRREAVRRIGELLQGEPTIPSEWRKQAIETLGGLHQADLAHEIGSLLARLPGGDGRTARADQRARSERAEQVCARVTAYWDGEDDQEPVLQLNAEERAQLLARLRGLPDLLARHVSSLIEDSGQLGPGARSRMLLGALEKAGDPRLLPALRSLLSSEDAETFEPCVRAIAAIEDPRVLPLLRDAYERAVRPRDRLVLITSLGGQGDGRGLGYARETLSAGDPALLVLALEALAELGSGEDVQGVLELLEHGDSRVVSAAVATLGRIGDGRSLVPLAALRSRVQRSALRAQIEDAETAIAARATLLGEEAPSPQAQSVASDTNKMVARARARARDPAMVRVRARLYHFFAYVWLLLGAPLRAIARFEAASALRPGWLPPVLALARLYTRRQQTPQALATFRRAVDIDRNEVEADDGAITAMAQTFLRRAEAMEREGRLDIARSLVEEVLGYDLRRAAAAVRFALQERLALQVSREHGWKP